MNDDFCLWVSGRPASVARTLARALELELAPTRATVVLSTERASEGAGRGRPVVEVLVGAPPPDDRHRAPDVVVPGDGARAGESARVVLRHLAAAGYAGPPDEYSDDDEAAVSGRLQAFGYL